MTVDVSWPSPNQCKAQVWKRDTYRRTGRGSTGFELHYTACQCTRKSTHAGYCWQHAPKGDSQEGSPPGVQGHHAESEQVPALTTMRLTP